MFKISAKIKAAAAVTAAALFTAGASIYYANTLPDSFYAPKGQELSISSALPVTAVPSSSKTMEVFSLSRNTDSVSLRLFGIVPIKDAEIREIETPMLIPGGQPFGIKLRMEGAMVVSLGQVETAEGSVCPAASAGIEAGDIIQTVDGCTVTSGEALSHVINNSKGKTVDVVYSRGGKELTASLTPVYSLSDGCYAAGMWIRDSLAGVGTISYYDPANMTFGGLGHPICDGDTGVCIPIGEGQACPVTISGIVKGERGVPGMLEGTFLGGNEIGSLTCNNKCGVFGGLEECPDTKAIPMAFKQEITEGKAEIICTIEGETPKTYSIEIEEIDLKGSDSTKNMVIKITDKELLKKTGGIVQGMSGSPIIKDGKLIGAVTHVFVDDPTMGYGIFCENMYAQSRLIQN